MKDKLARRQRSKVTILILTLVISLPLFNSAEWLSFNQKEESKRILFYNVENLFDTLDCELNDDEFLPDGERRWNRYKYFRKLDNISRVIVSAGSWHAPAIIGLCEVENSSVVSDLVSKTILKDNNYSYVYANTADERGIGVAIIFNQDFTLLSQELLYPINRDGDTLSTRTVLYTRLADDLDTLGLIVTHWPSRRGGVAATDKHRELIARIINNRFTKQLTKEEEGLKIILMGDLNCEPDSYAIRELLIPDDNQVRGNKTYFTNITSTSSSTYKGSYKYQGRWLLYDQILLNSNCFESSRGYKYLEGSFRIHESSFLLVDDNSYKGLKPRSTWIGPRYQGGYSDHLAVYIDLISQE